VVNVANRIEVRRVRPGGADYVAAVHKALDLDVTPGATGMHPSAAAFVASAQRRLLKLELVFGAFEDGRIVGACLAVESPGSSAMVRATGACASGPARHATSAALEHLVAAARSRGLRLLEALIDPNDEASADALAGGGFSHLTRLIYMRRRANGPAAIPRAATDLDWVTYSGDTRPLFSAGIEASYAASLDCPEVAGVRSVRDVLDGHRAVGDFDPELWWVARRNSQPVGVLLVNSLPPTLVLEVVYMGVAQPARGTGVGDALLGRAVEACRSRGMRGLALAVDERNDAARRLYARWGFVETGVRSAWIAAPGSAAD